MRVSLQVLLRPERVLPHKHRIDNLVSRETQLPTVRGVGGREEVQVTRGSQVGRAWAVVESVAWIDIRQERRRPSQHLPGLPPLRLQTTLFSRRYCQELWPGIFLIKRLPAIFRL